MSAGSEYTKTSNCSQVSENFRTENRINDILYIDTLKHICYNLVMEKPKFTSYRRLNGHDEFAEFYKALPLKERRKLVALIQTIEQVGLGTAVKMKWVRKLDVNLYEIRSKVASNIQRGLYFHDEGPHYVITHGFTKKTQKTPSREINHAKDLREEYYQRKEETIE